MNNIWLSRWMQMLFKPGGEDRGSRHRRTKFCKDLAQATLKLQGYAGLVQWRDCSKGARAGSSRLKWEKNPGEWEVPETQWIKQGLTINARWYWNVKIKTESPLGTANLGVTGDLEKSYFNWVKGGENAIWMGQWEIYVSHNGSPGNSLPSTKKTQKESWNVCKNF